VGQFLLRKNFIKSLMGAQITLPEPVWRSLNWAWTGFFAAMGVLNLWVAYTFDTDTWVNFKLFGGIGLMFAFVIAQALYLGRYLKEEEATPEDAQP
jgi:intracellular septation protein